MPTCKDVALRAGVSSASVSRAFHNDPKLRPETRKLILQAAEELNYYPNLSARGLKSNHSRSVGIIIPDIDNPWYIPVIKHMEKTFRQEHYRLLVMFDDGEEETEYETLYQMLAAQVDGIMFTPMSYCAKSREALNALRAKGMALMQLYTNPYEDIAAMRIDDDYGVYAATSHMLSKGYKRILNVGGSTIGYQRAYKELGIPIGSDLCLDAFDIKNPYPAIIHSISSLKPDAVLAIANRLGQYTLNAIKELGLSFPKDIGFMMYDDISWVSLLDISVIAHPIGTVADMAARYMLHIIREKSDRGLVASSIKPFVIERSSTNPPPEFFDQCKEPSGS